MVTLYCVSGACWPEISNDLSSVLLVFSLKLECDVITDYSLEPCHLDLCNVLLPYFSGLIDYH